MHHLSNPLSSPDLERLQVQVRGEWSSRPPACCAFHAPLTHLVKYADTTQLLDNGCLAALATSVQREIAAIGAGSRVRLPVFRCTPFLDDAR